MKLLEHEAKQLLTQSAVAVPTSQLLAKEDTTLPTAPTVLKAQVLTGRRNKFGGIQIVKEQAEVAPALRAIFAADIDGFMAETILAEELLAIERELYIHLSIDRDKQAITLLAHKDGGIDIESQPSEAFFAATIQSKCSEAQGLELAEYMALETHEFALHELVNNLLDCMHTNDATLLEINPLVLTKEGKLVAADCKMELDNAAAFRHPDWNFYDRPASANFVTLNKHGTVATIANGAGLAMATVDAVQAAGYQTVNFLDVGGGTTKETILRSFKQLGEYSRLEAIVINIFAGITRCDEVAKAILAAKAEISDLPPLFIRLEGTNVTLAKELLAESDLPLYTSLADAIQAIGGSRA
ncbi:MAG: ATP-grasp domain-containing protein [Candidatus Saccharimonadales bacterium]